MLKHILVFSKAQLSAFIGGLIDYGIMIIVTEFIGLHYTLGIAIGGVVGAIFNFTVNKIWTFNSKNEEYHNSLTKQLLKFVITVANSIFLKSTGTYFLTTFSTIDYKITRPFVDIVVSTCFNYTLQRQWVFKKSTNSEVKSRSTYQLNPLKMTSKEKRIQ